jgi:hypothetical protein
MNNFTSRQERALCQEQGYSHSSVGDDAKWSLSQAIVGLHRSHRCWEELLYKTAPSLFTSLCRPLNPMY